MNSEDRQYKRHGVLGNALSAGLYTHTIQIMRNITFKVP